MHYTHYAIDSDKFIDHDVDHVSVVNHLASNKAKEQIVFLTSLHEKKPDRFENYFSFIQRVISKLKKLKPTWKIFVLFDSIYEQDVQLIRGLGADDIVFVDHWLYCTMKNIYEDHVSAVSYKWNSRASKFLYLAGQPYRVNRLPLLYKLHEKNLLNHQHCVWSLHEDRSLKSEILLVELISEFPELSRKTIISFIEKYKNHADQARATVTQDKQHFLISNPSKYDVKIYSQTKFSVVTESSFSSTLFPFITEKIWKAILNYHPFIVAGDTGYCDRLNKMSFVTYDGFLKHADYDSVNDNLERLNLVVENVEYWCNRIDNYKNELQQITDYNHNQLVKRYHKNIDCLTFFCKKNNLSIDIHKIVPYDDVSEPESIQKIDDRFVKFYNSVKDQSWPDVHGLHQFDSLPSHIKSELIEYYGYVDTND